MTLHGQSIMSAAVELWDIENAFDVALWHVARRRYGN